MTKGDILKKAVGFLLQWVTHTMVFKLPGQGKLEMSQAVVDYVKQVKECLNFLPDIPGTGNKDVEQAVYDSVTAVSAMLGRLQQIAESAVLVAMLRGDIPGKDCVKIIPSDMLPLANVMDINWAQELLDIQNAEADLQAFLLAVGRFESACSLSSKVCQEFVQANEGLGKVAEMSSRFKEAYITAFQKALSSLREVLLPPLTNFLDKYGKVKSCAEKWDMGPVGWIFEDEFEGEVNKDLTEFKDARKEFLKVHSIIMSLVSSMAHTEQADLKEVLENCKNFALEGENQCKAGASLSAVVIFSDAVMAGNAPGLTKVDAYVKKNFGQELGLGHLPEKLEAQIQELQKQGDAKIAGKKPDKKEKKEKNETNKDKKRTAEDAKSSKEKKSRKSK